MPKLIPQRKHPAAVLRAEHVILLVEVGDIDKLPADTGVVGRQHAILALERPEPFGKCNLVLFGQLRPVEYQYGIFVQCCLDGINAGLIDRRRQVGIADQHPAAARFQGARADRVPGVDLMLSDLTLSRDDSQDTVEVARHVTGETLMIDAGLHLGFAPMTRR